MNTLLQENNNTGITGQDIKRMDYTYDLISGNVHEVKYQSGFADGMIHKYRYDADNRITHVYTSTDGVHEDLDAKYFYYAHGPLARTELGNEKVQGVDYVYTLHGWIKGVNSNTLDSTRDVGRDGNPIANNPNAGFAPDVYGYTLNYYDTVGKTDYKPIDATNRWNTVSTRFESDKAGSDALAARKNLWNGNIGMMVTTIQNPSTYATLPQAMSYEYDQLNRLKVAKGFVNLNMATNTWQNGSTYANRYLNQFTYDANGNILSQVRHAENGTQIENLSYKYERNANGHLLRNRLYHVNETVAAGTFSDDIDDQGVFSTTNINTSNNYGYDEEGRLIRDDAEDIAQIKWTVTSKVKEVIRSNGSPKKNLKFDYDAMGQRVAKHVYTSANVWENSTYYVRDPQGNVMAVYEKENPGAGITYEVTERYMYGSSRIGSNNVKFELSGTTSIPDTGIFVHLIGKKQYELSNHLGNVLSTVSDKLIAKDWNNDNNVDSYKAEILSATDYTPFGVAMDGRTYNTTLSRYGFNGQEKDNEIYGDGNMTTAEFWQYDARLGRRWEMDPKVNPSFSCYVGFENNPIFFSDFHGDTVKGDLKAYQKVKDYVNGRIAGLNTEISDVNSRIEERKSKGKNTERLEMKLARLQSSKADYQGILDEYKTLEQSTQVYNIVTNGNAPSGAGGETRFNKETGYVDVVVNNKLDLLESLPHELKHAYQFETGKLSLGYNGGGGSLYDVNDEVEAFQRSQMFGYYIGEIITPSWVIRTKGYGTLEKSQVTLDTKITPELPITHGDQIKEGIYYAGKAGKQPKQVIVGWQTYYSQGATGQPLKK